MKCDVAFAALFFIAISVFVAACGRAENSGGQPGQQAAVVNVPEIEVKEGCDYNNPLCGENHGCVNNSCVLKSGCSYDNPPCNASYDCVDNSCVLKKGCSFNNPPCSTNSSCINNSCIPLGCKYNNPPCNSSQICQNNKCFEHILSSGGGGY